MNKKGFTLIELLVVIVLIALLSVMVAYSVNELDKNANNDVYESKKELILAAAKKWGRDNLDILTTECTNESNKKIGTLISLDYLEGDNESKTQIIDPRTNESMNHKNVCVKYIDNKIIVEIED